MAFIGSAFIWLDLERKLKKRPKKMILLRKNQNLTSETFLLSTGSFFNTHQDKPSLSLTAQ